MLFWRENVLSVGEKNWIVVAFILAYCKSCIPSSLCIVLSNIVLLFLVLAYYCHPWGKKSERTKWDIFIHAYLISYSMGFISDRENCKKYMTTSPVCIIYNQLLQCKETDMYIGWSKEITLQQNLFTYCTEHCTFWLVMYDVKIIKKTNPRFYTFVPRLCPFFHCFLGWFPAGCGGIGC